MLLPLSLNKFADALCLVPARDRAAEAQSIIAEAAELAIRFTELNRVSAAKRGDSTYRTHTWGDFVEPVSYDRRGAYCRARGVAVAPFAALTDRDGLQAYAVAVAALDAMIVAAEDRAVAA